MEWIVSAAAAVAGVVQKERDRGRVVVEGDSGWPAADPVTITGPSIAWVKVTNRTGQPVQVDGLGFLLGKRHIPLVQINRPMPAYLAPGQSVNGLIRVKVNPRRLFFPLYRDLAA